MNDDRDVIEFAEPARGKLRRVLTRLRRQPQPSTPADLRRVLRGGCYANPEGFARCACRFRLAPTSRTPFLGFRLIHEL
jgi:formylglycine-generating enzyme required for sulfatase activity